MQERGIQYTVNSATKTLGTGILNRADLKNCHDLGLKPGQEHIENAKGLCFHVVHAQNRAYF